MQDFSYLTALFFPFPHSARSLFPNDQLLSGPMAHLSEEGDQESSIHCCLSPSFPGLDPFPLREMGCTLGTCDFSLFCTICNQNGWSDQSLIWFSLSFPFLKAVSFPPPVFVILEPLFAKKYGSLEYRSIHTPSSKFAPLPSVFPLNEECHFPLVMETPWKTPTYHYLLFVSLCTYVCTLR